MKVLKFYYSVNVDHPSAILEKWKIGFSTDQVPFEYFLDVKYIFEILK